MKELIDKLTSYNIFNYLLPGALFAVFIERMTTHKVVQADIVTGLFLYYFIGMVISRFGSLLFEPLAKHTKFVAFAEYKDFITVSAKDKKLDILFEANNTYRTLCSLFASLIVIKLYDLVASKMEIPKTAAMYILVVGLFLLFAFSYRKQTKYIIKRVEAGTDEHR